MSEGREAASSVRTTCTCVTCADCGGSGNVWERTNGYPEEDLETCTMCGGTGIVEVCENCYEADMAEQDSL